MRSRFRADAGPHTLDHAVWVPTGEDYGGVNDRYVLASRAVAEESAESAQSSY